MLQGVQQLAGDAWEDFLRSDIDGQLTVVLMAAICCWLLSQMAKRPRTSGALLLTWSVWAAWACQTGRLTWATMAARGYNVYSTTHLCAPAHPTRSSPLVLRR